MATCKNCKAELTEGYDFCLACGMPVPTGVAVPNLGLDPKPEVLPPPPSEATASGELPPYFPPPLPPASGQFTQEAGVVDKTDVVQLLFSFTGRINRAKFWAGIGLIWAAILVLSFISASLDSPGNALFGLAFLGMIWPGLAIQVKRWHDRNKSGWWVLIGLIPIIGPFWSFIETGFIEGTRGPNQYGLDPLGRLPDNRARY